MSLQYLEFEPGFGPNVSHLVTKNWRWEHAKELQPSLDTWPLGRSPEDFKGKS